MQQYTAEHQRAEALQQKVEELQQSGDPAVLQQESRLAVPKLNLAIQMQSLQPGKSRSLFEIYKMFCPAKLHLIECLTYKIFLLPKMPSFCVNSI